MEVLLSLPASDSATQQHSKWSLLVKEYRLSSRSCGDSEAFRWEEQVSISCSNNDSKLVLMVKNLLSRTEMRTHERKEWQSIRTVWDISRDDRARIANMSVVFEQQHTDLRRIIVLCFHCFRIVIIQLYKLFNKTMSLQLKKMGFRPRNLHTH